MTWLRDLGLGIRFAAGGGREGWARTALTAVGVGLGVALLLTAASVPHLLTERSSRDRARAEVAASRDAVVPKSDTTVLRVNAATEYRGIGVEGFLMRAEGAHPVLPPGVEAFPGPGEMAASPALRELLASPEGALLKERLPYRVTSTIADPGLRSPHELYFYVGSDSLTPATGGHRLAGYGDDTPAEPLTPVLVVLVILICVVLLSPVAIFIATAVRFGGDRRDRRLAALRLVGTDIRTTRRIAAGEALFGSLLGLLAGLAFFLVGRRFIGHIELWNHSAFPSDLTPALWQAALIAVAVPLSAVLVTLVAMRSVAVEPLGVMRHTGSRRRRLWWRLLVPALGLAVLGLTGKVEEDAPVDPYPIAAGAVLVLFGLALLLPWLIEAGVSRLHGGAPAWQLAVRRLQLNSGAASRAVSGITVAVAGAVALQMLFAAVGDEFESMTGQDPSRAQFHTFSEKVTGDAAARTIEKFRATEGVERVIGTVETYVIKPGTFGEDEVTPTTSLTVGDCATLKELAEISSCEEGDSFVVHPRGDKELSDWVDETARKGEEVELNPAFGWDPKAKSVRWTLPADAATVTTSRDPIGLEHSGIMATVGAIDPRILPSAQTVAQIKVDEGVEDVAEYVRNTAARIDPGMRVATLASTERDRQYASVQTGLRLGAAATLLLIASSMLISQLEQLRERKRLLSVLVAFGTRRVTLGWSVLWQTAVPVTAGLLVAIAGGLGLGAVMTWMLDKTVTQWWLFLPMAGAGGALIVLVTLLSLPLLWRLMRPDGLRTE
ncbi:MULTISPECIES: ABC transporter permease [Streptomyces]|uniref:ABC transporter permease n=2 Tax=Streptomyces TaxID=1883 RepID=UPI0004BE327E|nr:MULTISPECIES: FtsX-like permease family protein [Streptomyces]MCY1653418.1 FtsX-like permease family protein [Streptomyces sp. SL203]MCY1679337.1 FtsX-like permease family protein [Streptomyces sp. SL294]MDF6064436.1 FtsX-like permease family protein [Streptomyces sp. JH010]QBR08262.1 ABC transporter permease [Streptomyces sp. S501]WSI17745.1 FtsX-like permease family protein [[Kitasatospora] papulosa]